MNAKPGKGNGFVIGIQVLAKATCIITVASILTMGQWEQKGSWKSGLNGMGSIGPPPLFPEMTQLFTFHQVNKFNQGGFNQS